MTTSRPRPWLLSVLLAGVLVAGLAAAASGHGVSGGPLGPLQVDGPAGLAAAAGTQDHCDPLDPHACLLPFPSDHFTRADPTTGTGKRLALDPRAMPRSTAGKPIDPTEWNRNDGFSPGQMLVVKVPGLSPVTTDLPPITDVAASLDPDSAVFVLEVDPDGGAPARHPVWAELDSTVDGRYGGGEVEGFGPPESPELHDPGNGQALIIRPAVNWKEGHRYVAVLAGMRDATGAEIPRGDVFDALADDEDGPEDLLFSGRKAQLDALVWPQVEAASPAVDRDDVWLAWDFTIASEHNLAGRMLHMRDDAFALLGTDVPTYRVTSVEHHVEFDGVDKTKPTVLRRVKGEFEVPRYVSTPTVGARMVYDPVTGLPARQPTPQPATFTCNIPESAYDEATDTVHPSGVSLYGHGLLGGQSEINSDAETTFGLAHNWTFCATDWLGMASEDLATIAALIIPDLSNFHLIPDRNQQGILNFLYLGRLMSHPGGLAAHPAFQVTGAGGPRSLIDPDSLVYYGNSQGGIMGGALTAVGQDFTRSVLGVPGMNYSTLLRRSKDFDPFAAVLYLNYADELDRSIIISLIQTLWDRGEANGYAHHMTDDPYPGTPAKRVLLHSGFGDHQVANVTTEVEARTIGAAAHVPAPPGHTDTPPFALLDHLTGPGYSHPGSALMVWDSGSPAPPVTNTPPRAGKDPHETPRRDPAARVQMDTFFRTGSVVDVCTSSSADGSCQTVKRDG